MKKARRIRQKLLRNLFKGLNFVSVAFMFQGCCYGSPPARGGMDGQIAGVVRNKVNEPIRGIKVTFDGSSQYETTDIEGKFIFYTRQRPNLGIKFEDMDGEKNGSYLPKDTIINVNRDEVFIDICLDEIN